MADLVIDGDALASSVARVRTAQATFSSVERVSEELAGYTGHDGLAGRVRTFGGSWDTVRGQLEDNLAGLGDYLQAVVETFQEVDAQQACSLEEGVA